jgi:UrcA family protein
MNVKVTRMGAVALAGIAALFVGAATANEQPSQAPSVVVNYADLAIAHPDGASRLYQRIVSAAESVCPAAEPRQLGPFQQHVACTVRAVQRAIQQIGSPQLTRIYRGHLATQPSGNLAQRR